MIIYEKILTDCSLNYYHMLSPIRIFILKSQSKRLSSITSIGDDVNAISITVDTYRMSQLVGNFDSTKIKLIGFDGFEIFWLRKYFKEQWYSSGRTGNPPLTGPYPAQSVPPGPQKRPKNPNSLKIYTLSYTPTRIR